MDSSQTGEEEDEMIERLLKVEHPDQPTEIVIHVNMLKEGWDVTNLYTIVPLRAANARILIEQSIGRGFRLPLYYEFRDVLETFGVLACFKTPYLEGTPGSSDWMPCPPLGHQARAVDFCSSRSPSMEDRTVSSARLAGSLHSQG